MIPYRITDECRDHMNGLRSRGLPADLVDRIWWVGNEALIEALVRASDSSLAELARMWDEYYKERLVKPRSREDGP